MFLHVSVCPRGGGSPGPHLGDRLRGLAEVGVSRPTPGGDIERSGLGGVSRPTPRGGVEESGWGCLQAHTQRGSPGPHPGVYPSMH